MELHRDRADDAARRLDRALAADLFQTSVANRAFGLLLLNPPYDYDAEQRRTEHSFLVHATRYLADQGVLVFIVPRQRLQRVGPLPGLALWARCGAGPSRTRSVRSSTRWC